MSTVFYIFFSLQLLPWPPKSLWFMSSLIIVTYIYKLIFIFNLLSAFNATYMYIHLGLISQDWASSLEETSPLSAAINVHSSPSRGGAFWDFPCPHWLTNWPCHWVLCRQSYYWDPTGSASLSYTEDSISQQIVTFFGSYKLSAPSPSVLLEP